MAILAVVLLNAGFIQESRTETAVAQIHQACGGQGSRNDKARSQHFAAVVDHGEDMVAIRDWKWSLGTAP